MIQPRPKRYKKILNKTFKGLGKVLHFLLKPVLWFYLGLRKYLPGFKKLPLIVQQLSSMVVFGILLGVTGSFLYMAIFGENLPFLNADIYPKDDKAMTAGTITVRGTESEVAFTVTTGKSGLLSLDRQIASFAYKPGLKIANEAFAQNPEGPTATLQDGNVSINAEIKTSTDVHPKNLVLGMANNGGEIQMSVKKTSNEHFQPGIYNIYVTFTEGQNTRTITQNFAWGVLAINPLKSIYTPGETANLHFGVLDELGNTLCSAQLTLEITNPNGQTQTLTTEEGQIKKAEECRGNTQIFVPDYSAEYKVEAIGSYKLKLTAVTKNGRFFIDDTLEVKDSVAFDVERTKYPTRIFPENPYDMLIAVTANQDFKGEIKETLPSSFIVLPDDHEKETIFARKIREEFNRPEPIDVAEPVVKDGPDDKKQLTWNIDVKKGQTFNLQYTIKFPDVSPEFYLVGPLTFTPNLPNNPNLPNPPAFSESRQWQIASDAVVVSGGIVAGDAQFGGNQRKVVFVNSNWYAFYMDGAQIFYKKSSDGFTWAAAVNVEVSDSDNYNPSVDTSGNFIIVSWVDDSIDGIESKTIDTGSSDGQTGLCAGTDEGTIDASTFIVSVAATSTTAAVISITDTSTDTEANIYYVTSLTGGSCTPTNTDIQPDNIVFGSGLPADATADRAVLIGISSTRVGLVFQDGNLSYSEFDITQREWVLNNLTIASDTSLVFSVVTNGTKVWVLTDPPGDTTDTNFYTLNNTTNSDFAETSLDSDTGDNDQDGASDLSMFCLSATDCKIVYVDDFSANNAALVKFIDCDNAACSSQGAGSPATLDTIDEGPPAGDPAIYCSATDDCKVVYMDGQTAPDVYFFDCDNAVCTTGSAVNTDADFGSASSTTHFDIDCPTSTNCKFIYGDDDAGFVSFVDCADADCAIATDTLTPTLINYGTSTTGPKLALDCPSSTTCKVVAHDIDSGTVVLVDCSTAGTPETCATPPTPVTIESSVGTTADIVAVDIECLADTNDCKIVYTSDANDDLTFVDCNDTDCNAPENSTPRDIDTNGGAGATAEPDVSMYCVAADDCKILYAGVTTDNSEKLYFVDCNDGSCGTGTVVETLGPRFRSSVFCPSSGASPSQSEDCKMVYLEGTTGTPPALIFADCDTSGCQPSITDDADPWTSETGITSVSLTYDSTNTDLIANIVMDASETAYYITSDAATVSWSGETAYDNFSAAGDMDEMSTPESAAGTTPMGVLVRQGSNLEFDLYATYTPTALTQNHFLFRDDTTDLNTDSGYLAADDTNYNTLERGDTYRVRFELANTGNTATNYDYRLEYAEKLGSCASSTFAAVPVTPTTEPFEMVVSGLGAGYSDGLALSSSRLTATGSFVNGQAVEDPSNSTGADQDIANGQYSEFEYAFKATNTAVTNAAYCFRLTNAGSTEFFTYSLYPEAKVLENDNVRLHYKFDDAQGATAQDSTAFDSDGTLNNTPTWQTEDQCVYGKCLWFDGTNDENVSRADDSDLDFGEAENFSVEAWVKHNGAISTNPDYIIAKHDTTDDSEDGGYKIWMDSDGDLCFGIDDDITWGPDHQACSDAGADYDDDRWHHVVGVRDQTGTDKIYLYVDGNEMSGGGTSDTTTLTLANSNPFYVGIDRDAAANEWLGFIDDVKVSREAKTAAQVKVAFNSGAAQVFGANTQNMPDALSDGLVGYWKMDETGIDAEGETIIDYSGNANTGTLNGDNGVGDNGTGLDCTATGKFGTNCSLDGTDDYVQISGLMGSPADITLAAWVNVTATLALGSEIISLGDHVTIRADENSHFTNGFFYDGSAWHQTESSRNLVSSGWHHVAYTFNDTANSQRLYIDGELAATSSYTESISYSGLQSNTTIGRNLNSVQYFTGLIDEARVYKRALSGAEVAQLYNWAPGPVGYWKLDEKSGTSAFDSSTKAATGTITIGASGRQTSSSQAWNTGKYGSSFSADGTDDSISGSDANLPSGSKPRTLMAWVNPYTVSGLDKTIVRYGTESNNNAMGLQIVGGGATIRFMGWANDFDCSYTVPLNQWIHIAGTHDGTTSQIYVNGGLVCTSTSFSAWNTTLSTNIIGGLNSSGYFDGRIDDVKVYNYVRTSAQIIEDLNAGHPAPGSPVGTPIVHLKFNEGAENTCSGGTNDACNSGSSGNTFDGAATSTTRTNSGKFNKALDFDGTTSLVTLTNANAIDFDTGLSAASTFSAWIYADTDGENDLGHVFSKDAGSPSQTYIRVGGESGGTVQIAAAMDLATSDATITGAAATAVTTGAWHHVAMVHSDDADDEIELYIDGQLRATSTNGSGVPTTSDTSNLIVGNQNAAVDRTFDGKIDEFKVYNQALTASQILLDMNQGSGQSVGALSNNATAGAPGGGAQEYCVPGDSSTCTAPVGRWDLEEGSGTTANDTSGNGKTATITAGAGGWNKGKLGKGYAFDNAATTIITSSFAEPNPLTIEAWVYLKSDTGNDSIISFATESMFSIGPIGTSFIKFKQDFSGTDGSWTVPTTFSLNTWNHLALTYDGSSTSNVPIFYVNGIAPTVTTVTPPVGTQVTTARTWQIGSNSGQAPDPIFDGTLDNVRVFNYIRTPAQIAWDYNRGAPVGHWKMDECQGTTVYDSSGNSNTGTWSGSSGGNTSAGTCNTSGARFTGVTGKRNYSLDFDGTDDIVTIPSSTSISPRSMITLAAWAKVDSLTNNVERIMAKAANLTCGGAFDDYGITQDDSTDKWSFDLNIGGSRTRLKSTTDIATGVWSHIVATYDGSNMRIYLNGIEDNSKSQTGSLTTNSEVLLIGDTATCAFSTEFFDGMIDDVRVYNYGLTAAQVKTLFNESATRFGPTTGAP